MTEKGSGAPTTPAILEAAFEAVRNAEPHCCIAHPNGGICLGCGQPWRKVGDSYEPVVPTPPVGVPSESTVEESAPAGSKEAVSEP